MRMNNPDTSALAFDVIGRLDALIEAAPAAPAPIRGTAQAKRDVSPATGLPKRYRPEWDRPDDPDWRGHFGRIMNRIEAGGIVALIGPRGTGKTQLAAEAMRNFSPETGTYTTAMGLFLRIRASFGKANRESEDDIVQEMARTPLLVLDEIQERGNTPWEDRLLTHVLDRRYGGMRPTLVIANLTESGLIDCLGDSIISRLQETGGILEIAGPSHRIKL